MSRCRKCGQRPRFEGYHGFCYTCYTEGARPEGQRMNGRTTLACDRHGCQASREPGLRNCTEHIDPRGGLEMLIAFAERITQMGRGQKDFSIDGREAQIAARMALIACGRIAR